jgi:hypothetical protein
MPVKMIYKKDFEFIGDKEELLEVMKELEQGSIISTSSGAHSKAADWKWTEENVKDMLDSLNDQTFKVLKAFKKTSTIKYHELCKSSGLRAQKLAIRLTAIRRNAQKAVGHKGAWLVNRRWTIPGDREQRDYYIHPEAYPYLLKYPDFQS